jgi:hypothetical protein
MGGAIAMTSPSSNFMLEQLKILTSIMNGSLRIRKIFLKNLEMHYRGDLTKLTKFMNLI